MRYGLVIDLLRCMGCGACSIACKAERGTPAHISYNKVKMSEIGKYPNAKMKFLPMSCMHCKKPHCLEACPNEATYQRDDGLVLIDKEKCVGCGACVVACPYGSRQLLKEIENYYAENYPTPYETVRRQDFKKGTAVKCDFCFERLEKGRLPACVETCPGQARIFGDLEDPNSEVSRLLRKHRAVSLKEDEGTEPLVCYIRA